jgi:hypothetical protein
MTKPAIPATPLPWTYEFGEREWVRGPNKQPIFGGHYTGHGRKHGPRKPSGHVEQDMKFIVEACNSYPRLIEERERLREALRECVDYFDQRADAEYTTESARPIANQEMGLLVLITDALASLEKDNG